MFPRLFLSIPRCGSQKNIIGSFVSCKALPLGGGIIPFEALCETHPLRE